MCFISFLTVSRYRGYFGGCNKALNKSWESFFFPTLAGYKIFFSCVISSRARGDGLNTVRSLTTVRPIIRPYHTLVSVLTATATIHTDTANIPPSSNSLFFINSEHFAARADSLFSVRCNHFSWHCFFSSGRRRLRVYRDAAPRRHESLLRE